MMSSRLVCLCGSSQAAKLPRSRPKKVSQNRERRLLNVTFIDSRADEFGAVHVRVPASSLPLPRPQQCPEALYELMLKCWGAEGERPSFGRLHRQLLRRHARSLAALAETAPERLTPQEVAGTDATHTQTTHTRFAGVITSLSP